MQGGMNFIIDASVSFVSTFASERESNRANACRVGAMNRAKGGRGGRGGRGHGGRGGRGRGRGGGSGRGTTPSGFFDSKNPDRCYPDHEWKALSKSEFTAALAAKEKNKRKASAVDTTHEDINPPEQGGMGEHASRAGKKTKREG